MFITITSILSFIAVSISLICVIIMNITVGCYMKQAKKNEAAIEYLKAALDKEERESLGSFYTPDSLSDKVVKENITNAHSIQANDNATQIVNV